MTVHAFLALLCFSRASKVQISHNGYMYIVITPYRFVGVWREMT